MLWLINQATAGQITGAAPSAAPAAPGTQPPSGPPKEEKKEGILSAGGASFGDIKIDMNA
jgi:hypothetical protein